MSRSAGRVLIRPLGDYNAATTYEMLDSVEYNGSSYLCRQTSTGNLPTNKTYWQKLAEAGNDEFITLGENEQTLFMAATISKSAGTNEDVSVVFDVANSNMNLAYNIAGILKGRIGGILSYLDGSDYVEVTINSVSISGSSDAVTAVGKLVNDVSDAISKTDNVFFKTYNSEQTGNIAAGLGVAVKNKGMAVGKNTSAVGTRAIALGDQVAAQGDKSFAEGSLTIAAGTESHSEGHNTFAMGIYAHTEGNNTWARGTGAHAEGHNTEALGDYSLAAGEGTTTGSTAEVSIGRYNTRSQTTGKVSLFNVGNGADSSHKSNAFTVFEDGYISIGDATNRFKITKVNGKWGYYTDDSQDFVPFAKPYIELEQTVTLSTTADTTVTFTNAAITANSTIEPFTSVWGFNPTDVDAVTTPGECVVTLPKAASADTIQVMIRVS